MRAQGTLDESVALSATNPAVQQLFEQLKATQGLRLAYSESYLNLEQRVRLPSAEPTIRELLDAIGQATNTTYELRNGQIIFRKRQATYTISGYIRDAASGEDLIGASIWRHSSRASDPSAEITLGTSSNAYGFYSLTLPATDTLRLRCSYVGHAPQVFTVALRQDTIVNWKLSDETLAEVTVRSAPYASAPVQMNLPVAVPALLQVPTLLGEVDLMKGLQRLPGVGSGTDGSAQLYVRGSSPDHNLLLLDGVPIYNATHLFGFFSVFNADAINNVSFYKGGFPARYGGRLASVVDVQLKEGSREKLQGASATGLLSSRLMLEGPLFNKNMSFLVSGRYGHPGPITRLISAVTGEANSSLYSFYDLTAKLNYSLSHRNQFYLSTYVGQDHLGNEYSYSNSGFGQDEERDERAKERIRWGNRTTALRWNHVYHHRLFSNVTLTHSRYRFVLREEERAEVRRPGVPLFTYQVDKQRRSEIRDLAAKVDFDYLPHPNHHVRFGSSVISHTFQPNTIDLRYHTNEQVALDTAYGNRPQRGVESDIYAEDEIQLTPLVTMNAGLRLGGFWVDGATYWRAQPRLSVQYQPSGATVWQVSYARMAQFMHLLANPALNLPTDQWLPTTRRLAPETAQQWTLGYQRKLGAAYTFQAEAYYKDLRNIIEYKEGGFELYDDVLDWEDRVASGRGRSYGLELLGQRTTGRLTGWLGYTLARSERQFSELNDGAWFPFRYDHRHQIDFGGVFHWKERVDVSWGWGLASGFAVTLPTVAFTEVVPSDYDYGARQRVVFGARNGQRTRATHRLDVSISFRKPKRWGERTWEFGLYNAYSRRNPFMISFYGRRWNDNDIFTFYQTSLFPVLPMVSYRFKFQ
ncbi:MAG: TonB-dependent receptor [Tunicatimonas sp.]